MLQGIEWDMQANGKEVPRNIHCKTEYRSSRTYRQNHATIATSLEESVIIKNRIAVLGILRQTCVQAANVNLLHGARRNSAVLRFSVSCSSSKWVNPEMGCVHSITAKIVASLQAYKSRK